MGRPAASCVSKPQAPPADAGAGAGSVTTASTRCGCWEPPPRFSVVQQSRPWPSQVRVRGMKQWREWLETDQPGHEEMWAKRRKRQRLDRNLVDTMTSSRHDHSSIPRRLTKRWCMAQTPCQIARLCGTLTGAEGRRDFRLAGNRLVCPPRSPAWHEQIIHNGVVLRLVWLVSTRLPPALHAPCPWRGVVLVLCTH